MSRNLFVYGTLGFDEIVISLLGKKFEKIPATLNGHKVRAINDRPYPALIEEGISTADGYVLLSVDEDSFNIIKDWEDQEYKPFTVLANTKFGQLEAEAFIWSRLGELGGNWSAKDFAEKHLVAYLKEKIPNYLATSK